MRRLALLNKLSEHAELERFVRFMVVGVTGTVLDFSILTLLKALLGFPTLIANTISYSAGILNNFILNRQWTFSDVRNKPARVQFFQFAAVSLIGLGLNNAIVVLLEGVLGTLIGEPKAGYLPAKVVATVVVMLWNFFANRWWTFQEHLEQE